MHGKNEKFSHSATVLTNEEEGEFLYSDNMLTDAYEGVSKRSDRIGLDGEFLNRHNVSNEVKRHIVISMQETRKVRKNKNNLLWHKIDDAEIEVRCNLKAMIS